MDKRENEVKYYMQVLSDVYDLLEKENELEGVPGDVMDACERLLEYFVGWHLMNIGCGVYRYELEKNL